MLVAVLVAVMDAPATAAPALVADRSYQAPYVELGVRNAA